MAVKFRAPSFAAVEAIATCSIIAESVGPNCVGLAAGSDMGYNLDDGGTCGFRGANRSLSNTNPLLAALANNGGPTQTIGSNGKPRDRRDPAGVNGCGTTITAHQRGVSRLQGSGSQPSRT